MFPVMYMRKITCLFLFIMLVFTVVFPARAAIVFSDNFNRPDGSLGSDWTVVSGAWTIENGEASQSNASQSDIDLLRAHSVAGDSSLSSFAITAKVKIIEGMGAIILFRYVDAKNWYEAFIRQDIDVAVISKYEAGKIIWINSTKFTCEKGVWYKLKVEAFGDLLRFYVDDTLILKAKDSTFTQGKIGLGALFAHVHFDDVEVDNPGGFNVVPEPTPLVVSMLLIAGLFSYMLIRRKSINRKVDQPVTNFP